MFELDEAKRIDVAGLKAHPWFNMPVADQYKKALEQLAAEQDLIDKKRLGGAYQVRCWGARSAS